MITIQKSINQNLLDNVLPIIQDGPVFSLPVTATQLTWQTVFVGVPAAVTIQILVSLDGTNFNILASSTLTAGESQTTSTSANFIKARINAVTPGSCTSVVVSVVAEPGGGGSGGSAGGTVAAHAPTHYNAATDPVDVTKLAGYTGATANFLRADGTWQVPPVSGVPGPHNTTHEAGGSDPVPVTSLPGYPGGTAAFLRADGTFATPAAAAPAAHHTTHEVGGSDVVQNVGWINQPNVFVKPQEIDNGTTIAALRFKDLTQPVDQRTFEVNNTTQFFTVLAVTDNLATVLGYIRMDRTGMLYVPAGFGASPLNASQLTSGTIPDARLSANVALKNLTNQFIVSQRISNAGGDLPRLTFTDITRAADKKIWQILTSGDNITIWALNDLENTIQGQFTIDRLGNISFSGAVTGGSVPDARLSSNVALKNIDNLFVTQTLISARIFGPNSLVYFSDTSGAANNKEWRILQYGDGLLRIEAMNDGGSLANTVFTLFRNGDFAVTGSMAGGNVPDARLSANVALRNVNNNFNATQSIHGSGIAELDLVDDSVGATIRILCYQSVFQIYSNLLGGAAFTVDPTNGNIAARAGIYERGRGVTLGEWIDFVPSFTGGGAITLNNLITARYTLIGKTMTVNLYVQITTTVSENNITIPIPGGFVVAKQAIIATYTNPGATGSGGNNGLLAVVAGGTIINFALSTAAGFIIGNQWVAGTLTFSIQ